MKRDLRYDVVYPHPIEKVWHALTDSEALAAWLMPNTFAPALGHRFQFRTRPAPGFDGIVDCEVLELEPPRRVAYSWRGGGIDTVVRFTLAPAGQGTAVTVEQLGFRGLKPLVVSMILGSGWKTIVGTHLPRVLGQLARGERPSSAADCNR